MNIDLSIDGIKKALEKENYVAESSLVTTLYLALKLQRPLFLEGEAGVGKTEIGKVLSKILGCKLIRLQCYEGLDVHNAVYDWNYTRQMLQIRTHEAAGDADKVDIIHEIFSKEFLLERPLLQAISQQDKPAVLLIDELDRADEEFEAFLLELLSDFQITIPELGTLAAIHPPVVVITSNRTREIHDALKRRCLYFWIDYPNIEKELQIVTRKVPQVAASLAKQIVLFIQELRTMDLYKLPGVAETIDWATALQTLAMNDLSLENVTDTLGTILKYQDDLARMNQDEVKRIITSISAKAA